MNAKCQPFALGIAVAVVWAAGVLLLGLIAIGGWGVPAVQVIGSIYLGYAPTVIGAIIGALWALVDGFIAGALIGLVYNRVAR